MNILNIFKNKKVVVRFPPSPTGYLHVGRVRTMLFNYLFARQHGGKIIFRLEDTDKARSKDEYVQDIVEGLKWLGISYDEGPFKQSERTEIYRKYLHKMVADGRAYISHEPDGENKEVVRFKNPNKKVTFTDLIRGDITIDTTDLGDFVIARNINDPLYHLTVVVDDFEMGVTHIIRGDDGIANTPRQILIQEAIDAPRPLYAHLPLILAKDKSKLSGRKGAVSVRDFRERGYLPEAFVNFLALIGWNPGTEQEIFSMDELIKNFDITKISKGGGVFNEEKLQWFNREYIRKVSDEVFVEEVKKRLTQYNPSDETILSLKNVLIERMSVFDDLATMVAAGEIEYYFQKPSDFPIQNIVWKKSDVATTLTHLKNALEKISALPDKFSEEIGKKALWAYAEENGKGDVLWPIRYALSGKDRSPDPFSLMAILGKKETIERIESAHKKLNETKI